MNPIFKNIIAIIIGLAIGSLVNASIIELGYIVFPMEGIERSNMEELTVVMENFTAINFTFPFLAHALGTLIGALITYLIAGSHKMKFALATGFIFFLLGIAVSFMLPAPAWFIALDLIFAYIPMGWLGGKIAQSSSKKK